MTNPIFTGAAVAIVTPMRADGTVNYETYRRLIDWQLENGTAAIVACGTTGESSTLTDEEHVEVIRYAVQRVNGRVPVVAGTGSNDTAYALALSAQAKADGADALLMVTPYYNKTSQAGLVNHFTYIANRVDLPIILYNVPSRTGVDIKPETYLALSKHPGIVGIKEANDNIAAAAKTMSLCGDSLALYSGNDNQIVPFMSLGGQGVISVLANIMPRVVHDICTEYVNGKPGESLALQLEYLPLCNALFCDVNPVPVKRALNLMGVDVGECRMPLAPLSAENEQLLIYAMKDVGLL